MNWPRLQRKVAPYLFLLPFFLGLAVFWAYPALYGFYLSLFRQSGFGAGRFVGLANYAALLGDERFRRAVLNTTYYAAGSVFVIVPLALLLALVLHARFVRFKHFFRLAFFLPLITSSVVMAIMFVLVFDRDHGLLNAVLVIPLGLPPVPWLLEPALGIPTLILLGCWKWTGVNAVYFLVGLQNIPRELTDAAAIDGANRWQVFRYLLFPLLRPIMLFVVVTAIFGSYKLFGEPYVLQGGGGGPSDSMLTMTIYLYLTGFRFLNVGYAAAIGYVMMLIMLVLALVQLRLFGAFREE